MEITVARKRLEEMRADLDRTVSVLMGEHHLVRGGGAEPGDAGSNLTEADRNAAAVQTAVAQRTEASHLDDLDVERCEFVESATRPSVSSVGEPNQHGSEDHTTRRHRPAASARAFLSPRSGSPRRVAGDRRPR